MSHTFAALSLLTAALGLGAAVLALLEQMPAGTGWLLLGAVYAAAVVFVLMFIRGAQRPG